MVASKALPRYISHVAQPGIVCWAGDGDSDAGGDSSDTGGGDSDAGDGDSDGGGDSSDAGDGDSDGGGDSSDAGDGDSDVGGGSMVKAPTALQAL